MATDDSTLITEARAITGYENGILTQSDFQTLVHVAKRELTAGKGVDEIDFYGELPAERALFWLTCIFARMETGEIEGNDFSIAELDVETNDEGGSFYFSNFWKHYHSLGEGRPRGHLTGQRSDREYAYDNSATDPS